MQCPLAAQKKYVAEAVALCTNHLTLPGTRMLFTCLTIKSDLTQREDRRREIPNGRKGVEGRGGEGGERIHNSQRLMTADII